jgi:hypothetical protein
MTTTTEIAVTLIDYQTAEPIEFRCATLAEALTARVAALDAPATLAELAAPADAPEAP